MGSVRIIAGRWKSRKIKVLDQSGLRPTTDRIRETVFNWLIPYTVDAEILDLFAGTGILGFEALSRGAKKITAIEKTAKSQQAILKSVDELGINKEEYELWRADALASLERLNQVFDIIFLDPPFSANYHQKVLNGIINNKLLAKEGLLYIEAPKEHSIDFDGFQIIKQKTSGDVFYALLERGAT